jgi:hypothetical protein
MAPVVVPELQRGSDARAALAKTRNALGEANGRLTNSAGWYDTVRASYGQK